RLPNDEILSATMVAHVMEKMGVERIRIVDGGLAGWVAAGYQPAQDYFGNPRGRLPRRGKPEIAATLDDVRPDRRDPGVLLIDARPPNEFRGDDDIWLRKGHIPGAISFHWARLMDTENTHKFRPLEEVLPEL